MYPPMMWCRTLYVRPKALNFEERSKNQRAPSARRTIPADSRRPPTGSPTVCRDQRRRPKKYYFKMLNTFNISILSTLRWRVSRDESNTSRSGGRRSLCCSTILSQYKVTHRYDYCVNLRVCLSSRIRIESMLDCRISSSRCWSFSKSRW